MPCQDNDAHGDGNIGGGMAERRALLPDRQRAVEEEEQSGDRQLDVLGSRNGGAGGGREEPEAGTHAGDLRGFHGTSQGMDRLRRGAPGISLGRDTLGG